MRAAIGGLLLIIVTGLISGCTSGSGTKSDTQAGNQVDKATDAKVCMMQSGGMDVLRMTIPANVKFVAKDGTLHINAPQWEFDVWLVRGAQTVDEAIGSVGQQIKDQFKDFTAKSTTDLTVAGSPAKRLMGIGHEADDGDAGHADVIVFKVGDHVFVACTHGEDLTSMAQQGMVTAVGTAQTP